MRFVALCWALGMGGGGGTPVDLQEIQSVGDKHVNWSLKLQYHKSFYKHFQIDFSHMSRGCQTRKREGNRKQVSYQDNLQNRHIRLQMLLSPEHLGGLSPSTSGGIRRGLDRAQGHTPAGKKQGPEWGTKDNEHANSTTSERNWRRY